MRLRTFHIDEETLRDAGEVYDANYALTGLKSWTSR
jgi:hypothetical protein